MKSFFKFLLLLIFIGGLLFICFKLLNEFTDLNIKKVEDTKENIDETRNFVNEQQILKYIRAVESQYLINMINNSNNSNTITDVDYVDHRGLTIDSMTLNIDSNGNVTDGFLIIDNIKYIYDGEKVIKE